MAFEPAYLWAICLMYSLINYGWFFNISYLPGYLKDRFTLSDGDLLGAEKLARH